MTVQNQFKYAGAILTSVYDFTPSELNHLFTSPVQVIPPAGSNQTILVLNIYTQLTFKTTAYTFNTPLFFYTGDPVDTAINATVVAQVLQASQSEIGSNSVNMGHQPTTIASNKGIMYGDAVADSTTPGDGTARMTIMYRVIGLV